MWSNSLRHSRECRSLLWAAHPYRDGYGKLNCSHWRYSRISFEGDNRRIRPAPWWDLHLCTDSGHNIIHKHVMAPQGKTIKKVFLSFNINIMRIIIFRNQTRTDARGRGVLLLILRREQLNLMAGVPALVLLLVIVATPSTILPPLLCISLQSLVAILASNRMLTNITIPIGR